MASLWNSSTISHSLAVISHLLKTTSAYAQGWCGLLLRGCRSYGNKTGYLPSSTKLYSGATCTPLKHLEKKLNVCYTRIYIYIDIHRQIVSLCHDAFGWFDTQDASSWDRNSLHSTLDMVSKHSAISTTYINSGIITHMYNNIFFKFQNTRWSLITYTNIINSRCVFHTRV